MLAVTEGVRGRLVTMRALFRAVALRRFLVVLEDRREACPTSSAPLDVALAGSLRRTLDSAHATSWRLTQRSYWVGCLGHGWTVPQRIGNCLSLS